MKYPFLIHDVSIPNSWSILSSFMTYPFLIHDVSFPHSWRILSSFMTYPFLIHDVSFPNSWRILSLSMTYPFLIHDVSFPHPWLITRFVTRVIRRVSLMEQECLTLPRDPIPMPFNNNTTVATTRTGMSYPSARPNTHAV